MSHARAWDNAHAARLMIAEHPDPRLVEFVKPFVVPNVNPTRWLDVGCGTARSAEFLAQQNFIVCGFDSSPNAVLRAYNRLLEHRTCRLPTFMIADITKPWPYMPGMFDAVVDIRSLENLSLDEMKFAWKQAFRVLKRDGKILSVCASELRDDALTTAGKVTKLDAQAVTDLVRDAGFKFKGRRDECVYENSKVVHDWTIHAFKP